VSEEELSKIRWTNCMVIYHHKDQITYLKNREDFLPTDPEYSTLWPLSGWPYPKSEYDHRLSEYSRFFMKDYDFPSLPPRD
jgi:hypothetical protein